MKHCGLGLVWVIPRSSRLPTLKKKKKLAPEPVWVDNLAFEICVVRCQVCCWEGTWTPGKYLEPFPGEFPAAILRVAGVWSQGAS